LDGRFVALSSNILPASTVIVLESATGKEIRRFARCFSPVFSPDGRVLAGSDGKQIRQWALNSGAELPALPESGVDLKWVAVSQDGFFVAATYQGRSGSITWDRESRRIILQSEATTGDLEATALAFAPDGKLWLANYWGEDWLGGPPFFFSSKGRWIISGWKRKLLQISDFTDFNVSPYSIHLPYGSPEFLEVSDSGQYCMRISGAGIQVERLPVPLEMASPAVEKKALSFQSIGFTSKGEVLVAESAGPIVHWDPLTRKERRRSSLPYSGVRSISANGARGIVPNGPDELRVWDLEKNQELLKVDTLGRISTWALSWDGSRLAAGTMAGELSIWDVDLRKEKARVPGEVQVTAIAWSRDAKIVSWGDALGGLAIADGSSGLEPLRFRPGGFEITALTVLPDGRSIASGDRRGKVYRWLDQPGTRPELIADENTSVAALECSPDGRWLAAAAGRSLSLHPLGKNLEPSSQFSHQHVISAIAFSPDGAMLAACSQDGEATLWSVPMQK
jgi:WD40 repeat protein